ncbi:VanZ like family protein [Roseovarius sp. THAF9]|uniref:VanZ family protein n=1 Tax=Roseovarius sp. THAF9 TaxID=2587847 RepID=UPI001269000B|nr:VanZ family protein [Roseovarius sp. THAF9]QFT94159.1 VanZ like family protein [Roseovarius sp. THAF9]
MTRPAASRVRLARVLTLALALGILVTTLWPSHAPPVPVTIRDKVLHTLAFAALILPMAVTEPHRALRLAPLCIAFGAAIEVIQPAVGRGAEWLDLLADALGVGLGLALGWSFRAAFRRR